MSDQIISYSLVLLSILVPILLIYVLYRIAIKHWWFGVPFVRTKSQSIGILLQHIDIAAGQVFVDLGSGDGVVMDAVLRHCPWAITRWYELDPKAIAQSQPYQLAHGSDFTIIQWDYFQADISDADVIYCYLLPRLLPRVWRMITEQCKPGTVVYSYVFPIANIPAQSSHVINIPQRKDDTLFVYQL